MTVTAPRVVPADLSVPTIRVVLKFAARALEEHGWSQTGGHGISLWESGRMGVASLGLDRGRAWQPEMIGALEKAIKATDPDAFSTMGGGLRNVWAWEAAQRDRRKLVRALRRAARMLPR